MEAPPKLLRTVPEAAAMLGLSKRTIYRMVDAGELPVVWCGSIMRLPEDGLRKWVSTKTVWRRSPGSG